MRKLIVSEFVTLDGVMEDPGGAEGFKHGGWAFQFDRGAEEDQFKLDEVLQAGALPADQPRPGAAADLISPARKARAGR
jgi:hypothetical protein